MVSRQQRLGSQDSIHGGRRMTYYILVDKQEETLGWDQAGYNLLAPSPQFYVCQLDLSPKGSTASPPSPIREWVFRHMGLGGMWPWEESPNISEPWFSHLKNRCIIMPMQLRSGVYWEAGTLFDTQEVWLLLILSLCVLTAQVYIFRM